MTKTPPPTPNIGAERERESRETTINNYASIGETAPRERAEREREN